MSWRTRPRGHWDADFVLLLSFYGLEIAAAAVLLALHRLGDRALLSELRSVPALVLFGAGLALLVSSCVIVLRLTRYAPAGRKVFAPTLGLNLLSVVVAFAIGESATRISAVEGPGVPVAFDTFLLPRSWEATKTRNRALVAEIDAGKTRFVTDRFLGWTLGPSRRSAGGMYQSSTEGIRSARSGVSFSESSPRYRIALVGDSHTYGEEVSYEGTWGQQLQEALGADFQVLNFGVPGYGIDQAYLRYKRDVLPWHPDYVIFGVVPSDVYRSMTIYTFIAFPQWDYPFSKPRFVLQRDGIGLLNVPLRTPEELWSTGSIKNLPYVEHDISFDPREWQWHLYDASYLTRFALSAYPPTREVPEALSKRTTLAINREILAEFLRLAAREGSVPILVYLPSRRDMQASTSGANASIRQIVRDLGAPYIDLTGVLEKIPAEKRHTPGGHYTPSTNRVVAEHLKTLILQQVSRRHD